MFSKLYPILFFAWLLPSLLPAQDQLTGKVVSAKTKEPVLFATVFWEGTSKGTVTDDKGEFKLAWPDSFPASLRVNNVGFKTLSLSFDGKSPANILVQLTPADTLKEVQIVERRRASEFSYINPVMAEGITQRGLRKAACCNLSESFETNPTVDASMSDAVSGAKKIQLLGLDGVYSQILFENFPLIRGLSSSYGLSYIPGTWVKGILITKGTGSVVNGYESIAGQLNIDLEKPNLEEKTEKPFFINVYGNQLGRFEGNFQYTNRINDRIGTTLLLHASTLRMRNDMNRDGFLDLPLYTQYNVMNRWSWEGKKMTEGQFGFHFVDEDRQGGQVGFEKNRDFGTTNFYGIGIHNRQLEFFNKAGIIFPAPERSLGTMFSVRWHRQDMFFGLRQYSGEQQSVYANVIWQDMISNTNHLYKTGASFVLDHYIETFNGTNYDRLEIVPGIFFEYTGHLTKKFTAVAGIRADLHDEKGSGFVGRGAGVQITPRLHLKYDLFPKTILRASGGRGFRTANIFVENSGVFASSRQLIIETNLQPEVAWNYGGSLQQGFTLFKNEATLVIDFFRTDFQNQVVVDMEDDHMLRFYNLAGKSFANSFQADLLIEPVKRFDIRIAYKYYDVETTYDGILKSKPLTAKHRAFINLAYALPFDKWTFDFTTKWIGSTRVPGRSEYWSKPYFLLSANIGHAFRRFDVYAGAENLLNFRQPQPVLSADNPFGPDFDASRVYAPTDGITIYAGLRIKF